MTLQVLTCNIWDVSIFCRFQTQYQKIDVNSVEMMSVACQTPSSDVFGGRYRSHDPLPFSKVCFDEYSFSIILNFLIAISLLRPNQA